MESNLHRQDFYPYLNKTEIPEQIFKILGIKSDALDYCKHTISGGGSTVTKQAWGKILKKLELLSERLDLKS
ncbi:MAG TPA: hypothetical protein PK946_01960 [Tenuifilaceae bacterium]|nr:hypothetical protein [Tenuifilaceae bacterium]